MSDAVTLGDELTVSADRFRRHGADSGVRRGRRRRIAGHAASRLDLGVTFIDTANVYGGGANERLIARLLADRRDEVTLATKFGIVGNPADRPAGGGLDARGDAAYVRAEHRREPGQARDRRRRPLLHAPTRRDRADRGDRRRDGRTGRRRQGPPSRAVRGDGRRAARRGGDPPHRRRAERMVDLESRRRAQRGARPPRSSASASSRTRRWAAGSSPAPSGPPPTWPRDRTSGADCPGSPATRSTRTWPWSR